jgi:hypothetical protein
LSPWRSNQPKYNLTKSKVEKQDKTIVECGKPQKDKGFPEMPKIGLVSIPNPCAASSILAGGTFFERQVTLHCRAPNPNRLQRPLSDWWFAAPKTP